MSFEILVPQGLKSRPLNWEPRVLNTGPSVKVLVAQSCPSNSMQTLWTVACQAPLSMEFSRQEYWIGLPFPSLGYLPDPGMDPRSPSLQADSVSSKPPEKSPISFLWNSTWHPILHSHNLALKSKSFHVLLSESPLPGLCPQLWNKEDQGTSFHILLRGPTLVWHWWWELGMCFVRLAPFHILDKISFEQSIRNKRDFQIG